MPAFPAARPPSRPPAAAGRDPATIVARDLLDMSATAGEIRLDLKHAAKALADAYLGERDEADAIRGAMRLLYSARARLGDLILEIEDY